MEYKEFRKEVKKVKRQYSKKNYNEALNLLDDLLKKGGGIPKDKAKAFAIKSKALNKLGRIEESEKADWEMWKVKRRGYLYTVNSLLETNIIDKQNSTYHYYQDFIKECDQKIAYYQKKYGSQETQTKKQKTQTKKQKSKTNVKEMVKKMTAENDKYVPVEAGFHGLRTVYGSFYDHAKDDSPSNVTVIVPFYTGSLTPELFDKFMHALFNFLDHNSQLGDWYNANTNWRYIDKRLVFQYKSMIKINSLVWEKVDREVNNKKKFMKQLKKIEYTFYSKLFQSEKRTYKYEDMFQEFLNNIDTWYSIMPSDKMKKHYGLVHDVELCTFLRSKDYLKISDIPSGLIDNTEGLEIQTIDGQEYLEGCYALGFEFVDSKEYNLRLIQLSKTENVKKVITEGNLLLGFPCKIISWYGNFRVQPIILTDIDSRRLYSQISLEEGKVVDNGWRWWDSKDIQKENYLIKDNGIKYGINAISILATRIGNIYRFMRLNTEYVSYELWMNKT